MKEKFEALTEKCGKPVAILLILATIIVSFAIAFGWFCLLGWLIMLLWNWLVVGVFGATIAATIDYWAFVGIAFALSLLGKLLFKSK